MTKRTTIELIIIATVVFVLLMLILVTQGCSSIPILDNDHKCQRSPLAGKLMWYNEYTGNMMMFNDDCTGSLITLACSKSFVYDMMDYNNVKLVMDASVCSLSKANNRIETCSFTMERMLDIHEEVLDFSCTWDGRMNQ